MNYKNIDTREVISESDYRMLPSSKQHRYTSTFSEPTHRVEQRERTSDSDDDGFGLGTIVAGAIIADALFSGDTSMEGAPDFSSGDSPDFGGGDFGGAGAGSDW